MWEVTACALAASFYFFIADRGATGAAGEWGASFCDEVAYSQLAYNQCVSDVYGGG